MGYNSFLKSPKEEEQEVPDSIIIQLSNNKDDFEADDEVDVMDDLERILGIDDEEKFSQSNSNGGQLSWEFMDWDEFRNAEEEDEEEEREQKVLFEEENKCFFEEESYCNNYKGSVVKSKTSVGFWDDDFKSVSLNLNLNLNLNYQEVLDAWSDRGSLWAEDYSLSLASNGCYMGEVPVMEEEKARREASVLRYKEKRQNRLFSKKIRYQVRKLNADKRPRLKGRFVKRVS